MSVDLEKILGLSVKERLGLDEEIWDSSAPIWRPFRLRPRNVENWTSASASIVTTHPERSPAQKFVNTYKKSEGEAHVSSRCS